MDILNFALICGAIGVAYGLVTTTWVRTGSRQPAQCRKSPPPSRKAPERS